jgi:hypothetical protein
MNDKGFERRIAAARVELHATLDPTPPDFGRLEHRVRGRRRAVAGALAGLLFATAAATLAARDTDRSHVVAGPDDPTTTASTPDTTLPPPAPTGGSAFHSSTTLVRGVPTVLAGYSVAGANGTTGRIDVLEWDTDWRTAASFDVPVPGVAREDETARPLLVRDVTGDDEPDFLVPIEAASRAPYQVVSNHGDSWKQVPFGSPDRVVVTDLDDSPTADRLVTSTNLCEPSCADGRYRRDFWRYSAAEGLFVVVETAVCDALATGRWRCDPPGSPVAGDS